MKNNKVNPRYKSGKSLWCWCVRSGKS